MAYHRGIIVFELLFLFGGVQNQNRDKEHVTIDETFNIGKEESTELIINDEPIEHGKSKANGNATTKHGTNSNSSNNNAYENEAEENEDYDEYEEDEMGYEVG